jgi:hypothetical protein
MTTRAFVKSLMVELLPDVLLLGTGVQPDDAARQERVAEAMTNDVMGVLAQLAAPGVPLLANMRNQWMELSREWSVAEMTHEFKDMKTALSIQLSAHLFPDHHLTMHRIRSMADGGQHVLGHMQEDKMEFLVTISVFMLSLFDIRRREMEIAFNEQHGGGVFGQAVEEDTDQVVVIDGEESTQLPGDEDSQSGDEETMQQPSDEEITLQVGDERITTSARMQRDAAEWSEILRRNGQ